MSSLQHKQIGTCFRCTSAVNSEKGIKKYVMKPESEWVSSSHPECARSEEWRVVKRRDGTIRKFHPKLLNSEWVTVQREFVIVDLNARDKSQKRIFRGECPACSTPENPCFISTFKRPEGVEFPEDSDKAAAQVQKEQEKEARRVEREAKKQEREQAAKAKQEAAAAQPARKRKQPSKKPQSSNKKQRK